MMLMHIAQQTTNLHVVVKQVSNTPAHQVYL